MSELEILSPLEKEALWYDPHVHKSAADNSHPIKEMGNEIELQRVWKEPQNIQDDLLQRKKTALRTNKCSWRSQRSRLSDLQHLGHHVLLEDGTHCGWSFSIWIISIFWTRTVSIGSAGDIDPGQCHLLCSSNVRFLTTSLIPPEVPEQLVSHLHSFSSQPSRGKL